ncbi:MAG: chemotaxis protein CheA, partial [Desulfobacterales bacterium]|nr:chemotaxis protein CheA [Desulfobacterales bacterium]
MYDENTINEFVIESREHLNSIEPDFLILEQKKGTISNNVINSIFRAIHSIKGASGFFGFEAISKISHAMENILMKFRDGEKVPDSESIDILFSGMDKLRIMLDDVHNSESVPYEDELKRLNFLLGIKPQETSHTQRKADVIIEALGTDKFKIKIVAPPLESMSFEVIQNQLISIYSSYLNIYAVWIYNDKDLNINNISLNDYLFKIKDFGECLFKDFEKPELSKIIFSTVIDSDIIDSAFEIPLEQIILIDKSLFNPEKIKIVPKISTQSPKLKEETINIPVKEAKLPSPETIRVAVNLIDRLMNLASELVLGRNQLRQELSELVYKNPKLGRLMQQVDLVTSEVQEGIMQMRMQPIANLFNKFPRIVRDLSHNLEKEAELLIEGQEVEIDKSIIEGLSDPLTHLIRNSVDHGIEMPDERIQSGKPSAGKIFLKAFHEAGQVHIIVSDDGKGINSEKLIEKAIAKGLLTEASASKLNDKEKINLIFAPGLSTSEKVSDISGRGVGMDVVKTNIEKLRGHLEIESVPLQGTSFRIRLPLTLAIIPSLIIGAGGYRFAIPQINVQELVRIIASEVKYRIERIGNSTVMRLREKLLPIVRLVDVLNIEKKFIHPKTGEKLPERRENIVDRRSGKDQREKKQDRRKSYKSDINVAVLKIGHDNFGLIVDELFDNEEIVVKPLSTHIKDTKCFAGATIMGDGKVAMIIDAAGIADFANLKFGEVRAELLKREKERFKNKNTEKARHSILL